MFEYYDILQVNKSATKEEIKKSYKKLCMTMHPDKEGGSEEEFKKLNEAYKVLSNDEKRKEYDLYGVINPSNDEDKIRSQAANLVLQALESNSENVINDLIAKIVDAINQKKAQNIALLDKKEKLERKLKRIKVNEKSKLLMFIAEKRIEDIINNVNKIRSSIEIDEKLIAEIKNYEYEPDTTNTAGINVGFAANNTYTGFSFR